MSDVPWVALPVIAGILLYTGCAFAAYPYARPRFPIGLLVLSFFFPVLFPFLLVYACLVPPVRVVVVQDPPHAHVVHGTNTLGTRV